MQSGGAVTTFCKEEGILSQKSRDRNGICIAILLRSIEVEDRHDSPERTNSTTMKE